LEQQQCDISGWLLKKRRKKLQGWAKRWFELSNTGVLSYSTTPEGVTRGSIQILLSTITLNPKQRIIHIDSGSTLYHLRCQTDQDYTNWTAAFKVYKEKEPVPVIIDDNVPSDLDYAGADRICSEIDKGLGLADSLYSAMALHERNTQHYKNDGRAMDSAMCEESQHIYYMVQKQASQWKRLKELMQRMLQADASLLQLSRVQSNSKISSHLKPDYGNDDTHSSRNSIMSDQFYDAESAILTFDEDEDDYAVGIVSGSSSTYTTEEEQGIKHFV
jgi:hypothetical protein